MMSNDEIEMLLGRVALADRTAFRDLYEQVSPKLFGTASRIVRDETLAEDVLQEVFVQIWNSAGAFRANGLGSMAWLVTLTRNAAIGKLRQQRAAQPPAELDFTKPKPGPKPEELELASEEGQAVNRCLATLTPEKADLVRRIYTAGYSYAELAEGTGIEPETLRGWLRSGVSQLRKCLST